MSLDHFRRTRLVVLTPRSTVYQAARAMADNHIGAVLVSRDSELAGIVTDRDLGIGVLGGELDPKTTPLGDIMSEGVVACDVGASLDDVVRLMIDHAIRRVPITENNRPVGLITFDDLVVDGSVDLESLRAIVTAQLEVETPHKPAGVLHPTAPKATRDQAAIRTRALLRAKARAEATYNRMINAVMEATRLDRVRAERALIIAVSMLCRRLTPEEARDLVAQLPSMLQPALERCLDGPDRSVTAQAMTDEIERSIGLDREAAHATLRGVFKIVGDCVAAGQIDEVRGQLPEDMKTLLPTSGGK